MYEVTNRTIQERFLLRPGTASREQIHGVIGRGQELYSGVRVHAYTVLSNQLHMLISSNDASQLARFIGYVLGNIARRIGKLHGWRGPFWAGRARVIPIVDSASHEARLRYILAHGVKERLVARPEQWPGASSTPGLLGGKLTGTWRLATACRDARDQRQEVGDEDRYDISLDPIPSWRHLTAAARITRVQTMIAEIVSEFRSRCGPGVAGRAAVLRQDPLGRPERPARKRAPICHAATVEAREAYLAAYDAFVETFRCATRSTERNEPAASRRFPEGSHPRAGAFVQPRTLDLPWSSTPAPPAADLTPKSRATATDTAL